MKRALLVGNDEYDNYRDLNGCANDVHALHPLIARHADDSVNFECLTGFNLTRDELILSVDQLLAPGASSALLFFAGHGGQTSDDVVLCARDGTEQTPGLQFSEVLGKIASSPIPEIVVLLDCCFAGGAGGVPALASNAATLRPGLTILAASRNDQTSAESSQGRGLFSTYLEGALDGGASDTLGRVDMGNLYAYVSESFGAWEQRPTFKANIQRPLELRICKPYLSRADLREVLSLFPEATFELPLDPSFEPDAEPRDSEHERVFGLLQKARAASLLEPIDEDHLYFSAMNSGGCRLTPLGRHYHHVHSEDRL
ncbi:MAG TPA: caspase family protein [Nocardioidaceae bacterium]|nr:caspase family protein [Nocardioidaceae bacterium]